MPDERYRGINRVQHHLHHHPSYQSIHHGDATSDGRDKHCLMWTHWCLQPGEAFPHSPLEFPGYCSRFRDVDYGRCDPPSHSRSNVSSCVLVCRSALIAACSSSCFSRSCRNTGCASPRTIFLCGNLSRVLKLVDVIPASNSSFALAYLSFCAGFQP